MEMTDEDGKQKKKVVLLTGFVVMKTVISGPVPVGLVMVMMVFTSLIRKALGLGKFYCRKFVPMSALVERSVIACLCVAAPRSMLSTLQPKVLISAKTGSVLQTKLLQQAFGGCSPEAFSLPGKKRYVDCFDHQLYNEIASTNRSELGTNSFGCHPF